VKDYENGASRDFPSEDKWSGTDSRFRRADISDGRERVQGMLRKKGFRVTRQRQIILDVIFDNDCSSCKEIYYLAARKDPGIGMATVYRMVNTLTEIGVLQAAALRPAQGCGLAAGLDIELSDGDVVHLNKEETMSVINTILRRKGIRDNRPVRGLRLK